jgi:predicted metal-dependent peptidase
MMKLNSHPRLIEANKQLFHQGLEYYSHFLSFVDFYEAGVPPLPFPTFGVTIINLRLAMLWNREYLDSLSDNELKWLMLHELYHLLFNHIKRTKGYKHRESNIAQDMIINHLLKKHYSGAPYHFTEPLVTEEKFNKLLSEGHVREDQRAELIGKSEAVQLDPNYKGELIFEPLYNWLMKENAKPNQGALSEDTKRLMARNDGQSVDAHLPLDADMDEIRERIVQEVSEKVKQLARGNIGGSTQEVLDLLLRRPKKDNLRLIRKAIGEVKGSIKSPTYRRPSRKVEGTKGNVKIGRGLTVIWDWSGSMYGEHENVASELYKDGYELDIVGSDTQVNRVYKVKSKQELRKVPFMGGGGTELMPAIRYVADPKNKLSHKPLVILTDGYTDGLDFSGWGREVLILTVGQPCNVRGSEKIKQIKIEK